MDCFESATVAAIRNAAITHNSKVFKDDCFKILQLIESAKLTENTLLLSEWWAYNGGLYYEIEECKKNIKKDYPFLYCPLDDEGLYIQYYYNELNINVNGWFKDETSPFYQVSTLLYRNN